MVGFARGVLETLGIVAAFVGVGLGWASALEGAGADRPPPAVYPSAVPRDAAPEAPAPGGPEETGPVPDGSDAPLWLVDGYNVVGVGLLAGRSREGWWRAENRRALLERVEAFDDPTAHLWVVFDGKEQPAPDPSPGARARVVFAPSADAWLLTRLRAVRDPARVTLVTGDRRLAARARHRGAAIASPGDFLARCRLPHDCS